MRMQLINAQQMQPAFRTVYDQAKALLMAGHRPVLWLKEEDQSRDQQEMYHSLIGQIAEQAQHLGATWDKESWKRLLIDEFSREPESGIQRGKIIPNLRGDGCVEVGVLSREFNKTTANKFIEFLYAWGAQNGVELT